MVKDDLLWLSRTLSASLQLAYPKSLLLIDQAHSHSNVFRDVRGTIEVARLIQHPREVIAVCKGAMENQVFMDQ
jgi:hypothetical protein